MIRAKIGGLQVRGFRRFQEERAFRFIGPGGRPPSALIVAGPNGLGKTSFFEAILYALGRGRHVHRELIAEDRHRWFRSALAPDVRVCVTLDVLSAPGTLLGTRAPCSLEIARSESGWSVRAGDDAKPISDDEGVIRSLVEEIPVEWFSSWRQPYLCGPVRPMSDPPPRVRGEDGQVLETGRLWELKQRIVDERTRSAFSREPGRDKEWLEALSRAWTALRGDDGTRLTVGPGSSDTRSSHFDLYISRISPEDGEEVRVCPVDQLSSGEVEWLALVGTLITTDFDGIVLIDEPELHMHPEWQARLLPSLRLAAPDCQLIIATHADPPWDQAYSFERLLLVPPDDPRAQKAQLGPSDDSDGSSAQEAG